MRKTTWRVRDDSKTRGAPLAFFVLQTDTRTVQYGKTSKSDKKEMKKATERTKNYERVYSICINVWKSRVSKSRHPTE